MISFNSETFEQLIEIFQLIDIFFLHFRFAKHYNMIAQVKLPETLTKMKNASVNFFCFIDKHYRNIISDFI